MVVYHRTREKGELFLSQFSYLKYVVEQFKILDVKIINTLLVHHTKFLIL